MVDPAWSLIKPFVAVSKAAVEYLRRLLRIRRAGAAPFTVADGLLDEALTDMLGRFRGGGPDDSWWRQLLKHVENPLITPDVLKKPAVQEWLADRKVQAGLMALARGRIMGTEAAYEDVVATLRQTYAHYTGEHEQLATGPIEIAIAVLVAGYRARIGGRNEGLAGMVQAVNTGAQARHKELMSAFQRIGPDRHAVDAQTNQVTTILAKILKGRVVVATRAREELDSLARRVSDADGDLIYADAKVRAQVLYWAARLHASESPTIAKAYRERLCRLDDKADTRIIDALLQEKDGDIDGALRTLRDINSSDGRSVLFSFLRRTRGNEPAISWFREQRGHEDLSFLTGFGWVAVAVTLVDLRRWDESVEQLAAVRSHYNDWPDLAFAEGVTNAAMLVPDEFRMHAFQNQLFHPGIHTAVGPQADKYRATANECFDHAARLFADIGLDGRAEAAREWKLWLRLTDPKPEVFEPARREIEQGMKDGPRAVALVRLAHACNLSFDHGPLKRYLNQRSVTGGLDEFETQAEIILNKITLSSREFSDFLEQEETRLLRAVTKAALAGMRIEALADDNQTERARQLLEASKGELADDYERLGALITTREGGDPRANLEALYRQTGSVIDLENLVVAIGRVGDRTALRPLLEKLFHVDRTAKNARRLVDCLQRHPAATPADIADFLEKNSDLTEQNLELQQAKAWAYFNLGRLQEAKMINDRLLHTRNERADLMLDINLAIESGDWERFPVIIDREWPRRNDHEPSTLLHLATLAAQTDATEGRAFELASLAAGKAPDDPHVLVNVYGLAVQLGRDADSDPRWLARAIELSSEDGPIHKVDLRTIIEVMAPAHRDRARKVEEEFLHGRLSLYAAVAALNTSLPRVLIDLPNRNAEQQDGRQRTILPIISGARQISEMHSDWILGIDTSSLLLLSYLGILNELINGFRHVAIAPDTMLFLLNERRRARFHQPSQVKKAEQIRDLINERELRSEPFGTSPPQWLIDEVGRDLADLLEAARVQGGRVVRPYPIHQLRTYSENDANLGDYSGLVVSTKQVARALKEKGYIDSETYSRGLPYLVAHDRDQDVTIDSDVVDGPLFVDDLALTYLQDAGVLPAACHCGRDLRVHHSTRAEKDGIIAANRDGEKLAARLDEIRVALRDAMQDNKILLIPTGTHRKDVNAGDEFSEVAPALGQFFNSLGQCEAICVDDRFFNRHGGLTDNQGRTVPLVCIVDVLHYLERSGRMTAEKRWTAFHKLRGGGVAFVPLDDKELQWRLREAQFDKDGNLIESAELRVIRQSLMRTRSLGVIDLPAEAVFLDRLRHAAFLSIRSLWSDTSLTTDRAVVLSRWVYQNIWLSPGDWVRAGNDLAKMAIAEDAFRRHLAVLLTPMPQVNGRRYVTFLEWVQHEVLEPLLPANSYILDAIAELVRTQIEHWAAEIAAESENDGS